MQRIPDKEFDKIFQQQLDGFEVEPSKNLWKGIAKELDGNSVRKSNIGFLWMAASLVIALSVALWFTTPKKTIKLYGKAEIETRDEPESGIVNRVPEKEALKDKRPVVKNVSIVPGDKQIVKEGNMHQLVKKVEVQENYNNVAALKVEKIDELKLVVGQRNQFGSLKPGIRDTLMLIPNENQPMLASINYEAETEDKRGIQSVGDLVNFVVGKVDKRKDKIIEFQDTDEGSLVSGLNLGFVKIKSRNK